MDKAKAIVCAVGVCAVVLVAAFGVYLAVIGKKSSERAEISRPCIVVILADDLGWNDVGFHGSDQIPTPNIDALAYNGVILKRHYTLPTCTPSRTAFLTGRYPIRTGMQGYPMKAAEPRSIPLNATIMPEYLKRLGYSTHLIGKWHVGYEYENRTPAKRGFDTFLGYYNGYIQYFDHTVEQNGHVGLDLHRDDPGSSRIENRRFDYITDVFTEEAEILIANHDRSRPLYLQIAHLAVHSSDSPYVLEVRDEASLNETFGYIEDINRRRFAGVLTALDESVGRIVKSLERANMLKNSIVLFMSDNGAQTEGFLENYGSNYPFRGLKFTAYEGGVHGVACVYSPLIKNSSRVSRKLFHLTDWLPTLYAAAGGDVNDLVEIDGANQWRAIETDQENAPREAILINIDEVSGVEAAIVGNYKLLNGATGMYDGYYGDTGIGDNYPKYSPRRIMSSLAGTSIDAVAKRSRLTSETIERLREESRIKCDKFTRYASCRKSCLFDLDEDPCEVRDLTDLYPEVASKINEFIDSYRGVLMAQTNAPVDWRGLPEFHNCTWVPWLCDDGNDTPANRAPYQKCYA